jgi:hypothetical protein
MPDQKIIDLKLTYVVRRAESEAGTGSELTVSSSEYDSSRSFSMVTAQAEVMTQLILDYSNSVINDSLQEQFLTELISRLTKGK